MKLTREKGFTLAEFLIITFITGTLSTFMIMSSAKAVASQKTTAIIHDLLKCKRAVLACCADDPDALRRDDSAEEIAKYLNAEVTPLKNGAKYIKCSSNDEAYFNVISMEDQEASLLFIEYYAPDVNFEKNLLKGLAQYAKPLRLYKSLEDLSDSNLISAADKKITSSFYMLAHEVKK